MHSARPRRPFDQFDHRRRYFAGTIESKAHHLRLDDSGIAHKPTAGLDDLLGTALPKCLRSERDIARP
jgi:hypothetical protein